MLDNSTVVCQACRERVGADMAVRCAGCGRAYCGPCWERLGSICKCLEQRAAQQPIINPAKAAERFEGALREAVRLHAAGLPVAVVLGTIECIKVELAISAIGRAQQGPKN